ncbi:MAG TPA: fibronectin type III domain-containing protein [Solirubrobacterales bacterium]|nr:fibronectin type III domain-containing protein [Solirubrobacterales bacterium]
MAVTCVVAVFCTASAHASLYRMVLCGAGNGSNGYQTATNTASAQNPGGIFSFENYCGAGLPFPAGNNGHLRIAENQAGGNAGYSAYGSMSWTVPGYVDLAQGGGYTRMPNAFNDGWRGRFWLEGWDGSTNNVLMQGSGVQNGSCDGVCWATTSTFASHLWPFGGIGKYRRFVFEMTCFRQAGCDRTNFNAVDANTMVLTLSDTWDPRTVLDNPGSALLSGKWVRGPQELNWGIWEEGSGIRFERVRVDGGTVYTIDHRSECNIDSNPGVGEFARDFRPCPTVPHHSFTIDTPKLSDGTHTVGVCSQDYGQSVGLIGTGGESCDQRQVRIDNTAPAAPGGLVIASANPARYLDHFGAKWTLPADPGSPITKVHYNVVNAAGTVVVPEQVVSGTNLTKLDDIAAPKAAGDYRLRVWLEDEVGFTGPVATVPIPHDTTPPAAPQGLSVATPQTSRSAEGFDVRWQNLTDDGSPINAVHYQVLDSAGEVVVGTHDLNGEAIQSITDLDAPKAAGKGTLRLWLSDAEGNIGAPASAPLSYECVRSNVGGGTSLTAGFGAGGDGSALVAEGQGEILAGQLQGADRPGASICVFSRVVTEEDREFLGVAIAGQGGSYRFAIPPGPSREVLTAYRPAQREVSATTILRTSVHPAFGLRRKVIHNKGFGIFTGSIPGPRSANVVVVLQVKDGKKWRAFRRYRTREDGKFTLRYRFTHTTSPTTYVTRAQVRQQSGYPYEAGNSDPIGLRVLP